MKTRHYVNFTSRPIHLTPLWREGREDYKLGPRITPEVQEWIEEDFGPNVKGRNGSPCPKCSQTRILYVPGREWWRCCGLRVDGPKETPTP